MANRLGQLTRGRAVRPAAGPRPAPTPSAGPGPAPKAVPKPILKEPSRRRLVYAPQPNGRADPGEIVWTWVPFEEDPHRGKDRPVLVVGREGSTLEGLMLSSNSERDGQRHWFALGPGAWDREHRPSWVRLDRALVVHEDGIRREGAVLDRGRFNAIAAELRRRYGWA
jgi:PemK-like, MazF-like toxin of type II toxin-antitoxin system